MNDLPETILLLVRLSCQLSVIHRCWVVILLLSVVLSNTELTLDKLQNQTSRPLLYIHALRSNSALPSVARRFVKKTPNSIQISSKMEL
jgi:hypothetical protein